MTVVVIGVVIVVVLIVLALLRRRMGGNDGVTSFRRQIDALSSEARKPTVDQVKSVERTGEPEDGGRRGRPRPDDPTDSDTGS